MNCKIIAIDDFKKAAKKLLKKHFSLKDELVQLQNQLLENPKMGTLIHENTYKIRLAVKSKGRGKSGGMRIITHIIEVDISIATNVNQQNITIFLLTIYDKSEIENITDKDLKYLIQMIKTELDNE
jgi:mRNA-degrading endonuclease RelE of RelBE toxin-antitoxin system